VQDRRRVAVVVQLNDVAQADAVAGKLNKAVVIFGQEIRHSHVQAPCRGICDDYGTPEPKLLVIKGTVSPHSNR
jgi:hypothetical protein